MCSDLTSRARVQGEDRYDRRPYKPSGSGESRTGGSGSAVLGSGDAEVCAGTVGLPLDYRRRPPSSSVASPVAAAVAAARAADAVESGGGGGGPGHPLRQLDLNPGGSGLPVGIPLYTHCTHTHTHI